MSAESRSGRCRTPPKKQHGQAKGPRTFNGEVMDKAALADYLGCSKKTADARIARGLVPHHKWGGRIIILRSELIQFMQGLEGISVDEALKNERARRGGDDVLS